MKKYLQKSIGVIFGIGACVITSVLVNVAFLPAVAKGSECYDHWNGDAWHGAAEWAIVLCLDTVTMKRCEVRYHGGEKIIDLQTHIATDRGRIIWTTHDVYSFQYPGLLDVVCTSEEDLTYTFTVENTPNAWWDWGGCGPGTDYGGAHCENDQDENTLKISKVGKGEGEVKRFPQGVSCSSQDGGDLCYHEPNSRVSLTATPASGSIFSGWSGEGCSGSGECVVAMDQAREVTATFNKNALSGVGLLLLDNEKPVNGQDF